MKGAWVTLATNDSYSLGALVLAHSLKQVGTTQELAILVTPGVTNSMRTRLFQVFNLVQEVNVLDSRDKANLKLLQRPELGITFTKLHCWRLTQYEKCVFLDADTLVLQNCDELFDREELSAAPDVGWPDCFNSGVFVYRPSGETYDKLIQFALDKGSFDGGDQGLLNLYFSDWAHKDISKHLPFIYNVCSTAFYSYLPAFKQFGKNVKIIHFIGNAKPWLQYFDTETRRVRPTGDVGHLSAILQRWWDIFCSMIHPNLSPDMTRNYPETVSATSPPPPSPQRPYTKPQTPVVHTYKTQNVWDPWEEYDRKQQNSSSQQCSEPSESHNTNAFSFGAIEPSGSNHSNQIISDFDHDQNCQSVFIESSNNFESSNFQSFSESHSETSSNKEPKEPDNNCQVEQLVHNDHIEDHSSSVGVTNIPVEYHSEILSAPSSCDSQQISEDLAHKNSSDSFNESSSNNICSKALLDPPKGDPRDNVAPPPNILPPSYEHTKPNNHECEAPAKIINEQLEPDNDKQESGLAGAFAKLTLGQQRSPEQEALENNLRRQNWEQGNIDYLGKDSFDNIWSKICETLAKVPEQEPSAPEPQVGLQLQEAAQPQAVQPQKPSEEKGAEVPKEDLKTEEPVVKTEPVVVPSQPQPTAPTEDVCLIPTPKPVESAIPSEPLVQSTTVPSSAPVIPSTDPAAPAPAAELPVTPTCQAPVQCPIASAKPSDSIGSVDVTSVPQTPPSSVEVSKPTEEKEGKSDAPTSIAVAPVQSPSAPAPLSTDSTQVPASPSEAEVQKPTAPPTLPAQEPVAPVCALPSPAVCTPTPPTPPAPVQVPAPSEPTTAASEPTAAAAKQTPAASELTPAPAAPTPAVPTPAAISAPTLDSPKPTAEPAKSPADLPVTPSVPAQATTPAAQTPVAANTQTSTPQAPAPKTQVPTETPIVPTAPQKTPFALQQAPSAPQQAPSEPAQAPASPSASSDACPIAPPPRKSGGNKKQGKPKK